MPWDVCVSNVVMCTAVLFLCVVVLETYTPITCHLVVVFVFYCLALQEV